VASVIWSCRVKLKILHQWILISHAFRKKLQDFDQSQKYYKLPTILARLFLCFLRYRSIPVKVFCKMYGTLQLWKMAVFLSYWLAGGIHWIIVQELSVAKFTTERYVQNPWIPFSPGNFDEIVQNKMSTSVTSPKLNKFHFAKIICVCSEFTSERKEKLTSRVGSSILYTKRNYIIHLSWAPSQSSQWFCVL
jgi:hypothetical protein